jgi:hypothetical protein
MLFILVFSHNDRHGSAPPSFPSICQADRRQRRRDGTENSRWKVWHGFRLGNALYHSGTGRSDSATGTIAVKCLVHRPPYTSVGTIHGTILIPKVPVSFQQVVGVSYPTICLFNPRFQSQAKMGLVWDTGLMTTGHAALYSICIGHTENS